MNGSLRADLSTRPRLGVNVDHIATVRNARGGVHPDPLRAAQLAIDAGADGITMHLREDRRHIVDDDIRRAADLAAPLNLEMAATPEMQAIALDMAPHACCLVPERREERTTEGGLDAAGQADTLQAFVAPLNEAGVRVSLFIAADPAQIAAALQIGARVVEFHTGPYAHAHHAGDRYAMAHELALLKAGAKAAHSAGLEVHFGHGLTYDNITAIAAIPEAREFNIGHFLMGEAMFIGLREAVRGMISQIAQARESAEA